MNPHDLNLEQPLLLAHAPSYAEDLSTAARLVETVLRGAGFERREISRADEVPDPSGEVGGVTITYQRGALTAAVDIWNRDCQHTDSHRCFAFHTQLAVGEAREDMPFNRWKNGTPSRQRWRMRTDRFVEDLHDQLELLSPASPEGRLPGVVEEVRKGYGFLSSASISHLFFHRSALAFPWQDVKVGLHVSFVPGENRGRRAALAVERAAPTEEIIPARRDQATSNPAPQGIRPVDDPIGADAKGHNLGRIVDWKDSFGFMETLVEPRLFIHRSAFDGVGRVGGHLLGRGVLFRLAQADGGRRSAIEARLLPEGTDLRNPFQDELARARAVPSDTQRSRRFRYADENSFDCTNEKRPTIAVAALRDIVEDGYLLFIHTRWADLEPLASRQWLSLAEGVIDTVFLGVAPPLIYLSTEEGLYRLGGAHQNSLVSRVDDPELKIQLEVATPHPDD